MALARRKSVLTNERPRGWAHEPHLSGQRDRARRTPGAALDRGPGARRAGAARIAIRYQPDLGVEHLTARQLRSPAEDRDRHRPKRAVGGANAIGPIAILVDSVAAEVDRPERRDQR